MPLRICGSLGLLLVRRVIRWEEKLDMNEGEQEPAGSRWTMTTDRDNLQRLDLETINILHNY